MFKIAILLLGTHLTVATVCESIRLDYKNSVCCGDGGGTAVCTAPTFDSELLMTKIDSITALLQSTPSSSSCKTTAQTLGEFCFCPLLAETDTSSVWPPSGQPPATYVDTSGYPKYSGNPIEFPNVGLSHPPNFALCSSATQSVSVIFSTCSITDYADYISKTSSATTLNEMSVRCQDGMKMVMMFTIVLQFEYLIGSGVVIIGSTYLESLKSTIFTFPGAMGTGTLNPTAYNAFVMATWVFEGSPVGLTLATYNGHFSVVEDDTVKTSFPSNTVALIPNTGMYTGYPEHFDICLASRQMFDYMTHVPAELFPNKYATYTTPTRCTTRGMSHIKAHSNILGIEKMVTGSNANLSHCPTTQYIKDTIFAAAQDIRFMSPAFTGTPCHINDVTLETICAQAGPATNDAMFLNGDDAYYVRSFWITFVEVHVKAIHDACSAHIGESYTVKDPWGMASQNVELSLADLLTIRTHYETNWPRTNVPRETGSSLLVAKNYTNVPFREYAYSSELECVDDPVARIRSFLSMESVTGTEFIAAMVPQLQAMLGTPTPDATVCVFCKLPCGALGPITIDPGVTCVMSDMFSYSCQECTGVTTPDCPQSPL